MCCVFNSDTEDQVGNILNALLKNPWFSKIHRPGKLTALGLEELKIQTIEGPP